MGFSRPGYWSELPFLLQGIFLTQGWNLRLMSPALAGGFFTIIATWEALLVEFSGKPPDFSRIPIWEEWTTYHHSAFLPCFLDPVRRGICECPQGPSPRIQRPPSGRGQELLFGERVSAEGCTGRGGPNGTAFLLFFQISGRVFEDPLCAWGDLPESGLCYPFLPSVNHIVI